MEAFIYQDAKGNITARKVSDVTTSDLYIQAYCHSAKALRTFRKDRVLEYFDSLDSLDDRLIHHLANPPIAPPQKPKDTRLDVCFTGFKKDDKERLTALALDAGMVVRKGVTKSLSFLCGGYNAGPSKMEQARQQGVVVLDEAQFIGLLETGEIPDW